MKQGEQRGETDYAGVENGLAAIADDEVAAEDDLFEESGGEHGEQENGGDVGLFGGYAEADFSGGFNADEEHGADDGDRAGREGGGGGSGQAAGIGVAGAPELEVVEPELGEINGPGKEGDDEQRGVIHGEI